MRSRSLPAAAVTFALLLFAAALTIAPLSRSVRAQASTQNGAAQAVPANAQTISIDDIHEGMKGVAYTIFSGDTVEPMDLDVIGVLHNALGPKQDIILVQLHGEKVEHTGVVAGMSGSPVYLDGKLAGALSMKLGIFSKEAIGGVTPIENMLDVEKAAATPASPMPGATPANPASTADTRIPLPENYAHQTGAGGSQFLVPIETRLISTGLYPETLAQFGKQLSAWGMTA